MTRGRDDMPDDQRSRAREEGVPENVDGPAAAPVPEATGSIPLSISPTGGPAGLGAPVDEPPEETRRLALWVGLGIAVLVILVALIVWL